MRRLLPLAVLLALAGCGDETTAGDRVAVVATTTEVGDLVRSVGGERVAVRMLLDDGSDPHEYEPTPSDARRLADAALVFRSGGELDEWLGDLIEHAGGDARTVDLIESVRTLGRDGKEDPHWWQDPRNAILAVRAIRAALVGRDPDGAASYGHRAGRYVRRLRRLDAAVAHCISQVPRQQRKIVTTHDALGYFGRRYGVEIVGALIPSLSTQAQPSARDIQRLVDQIQAEGVTAIFPENGLNPKLERAVARESGAEVGRRLWADSLGGKGSGAETYVSALAANTEAMVEGMTGGRRRCRPE